MKTHRRRAGAARSAIAFALAACLLALLPVHAARAEEPWDRGAFAAPAAEMLAAAQRAKADASDVVVLLDERRVSIDAQHRLTAVTRIVYRVDSPAGVENWGSTTAYWQPWHQQPPQVRARVIAPDGTEHLLDQKLLKEAALRRSSTTVYEDTRVFEAPLPAVTVGAVVEEEITSIDTEPYFAAGIVQREWIGRGVPVLRTHYSIDAPESLPAKVTLRGRTDGALAQTRADGRVRWVLDLGPLAAIEDADSDLPSDVPSQPLLEISTARDWSSVADAYAALVEPRVRTDEVAALVAGAKAGASRRERIGALVARLHREVRYTGLEFGASRLVPYEPRETLARRFGDCKDKALVLVAMLRAVGIPAHLALLETGPGLDVSESHAGLGLFDHAIVYVPAAGEEPALWIDATAEYWRVGDVPSANQGRLALVVRPGERGLTPIATHAPADNLVVETREFELAKLGAARVVETTEARGSAAADYRASFSGPAKEETRKQLLEYVESTYLAEKLEKYEPAPDDDVSRPYVLRLVAARAKRGFTDGDEAVVAILPAGLFQRLPGWFDESDEDPADADDASAKPKPPRTTDVVFEPFATEWRYRVKLPPGFQVRALPESGERQLGPARLVQTYGVEPDGTVVATLRFDTVRGRYTAAEALATREALRKLRDAPALMLSFEQRGRALLTAGDVAGALRAYEAVAAENPKDAAYRMQLARALVTAGLAERARREAEAATRVEPKSAAAWRTLAWVRSHDLVGRQYGRGFDLEGALEAYRKARALDPKDPDIAGDYAILLEYDAEGQRYSPRAKLAEAVAVYEERRKLIGQDDEDSLENNPFYPMLYLRRFAAVRDGIPQANSGTRRDLRLAATAMLDGPAKAIEESYRLTTDESERGRTLAAAAGFLLALREYPAAGELLDASAKGRSGATLQQIAMMKATRRHEEALLPATDPRSVVQQLFVGLVSGGDGVAQAAEALLSRWALLDATPTEREESNRSFTVSSRFVRTQAGIPPATMLDVILSASRLTAEGDDGDGRRVHLSMGGALELDFHVVREGGEWRLLAAGADVGALGHAALARLDAGDLTGARRWLDWARDARKLTGGDDPLEGPAFARLWRRGQEGDANAIRTAAAALLATTPSVRRALPMLVAARAAAPDDATRTALDLALADAYRRLENWAELATVAERLAAAAPESDAAFNLLTVAYRAGGRLDALERVAEARRTRRPDDGPARYALAAVAEDRGDFARIPELLRPIVDGGRASASDYNQYAWFALLVTPLPPEAVDFAQRASTQTQNRAAGIVHTLACTYARSGRPKEGRDLLLQYLRLASREEPDDAAWLGFGFIAEAYGDADSARSYYQRVAKPVRGFVEPSSSYGMAQRRLAALNAAAKAPGTQPRP